MTNTTTTYATRRAARLAANWGRTDAACDRANGCRFLENFRFAAKTAEEDFDVDTSDEATWNAFCGAYTTAYERALYDVHHRTNRGFRRHCGLSIARRDLGLGESLVECL